MKPVTSHRKNDDDTEQFPAPAPPKRPLIDLGHWGRAERITMIICFTFILIVLIAGILS